MSTKRPMPLVARTAKAGIADQAINELTTLIDTAYPGLPNGRWVAMRVLEGDRRVEEALDQGEFATLAAESSGATPAATTATHCASARQRSGRSTKRRAVRSGRCSERSCRLASPSR